MRDNVQDLETQIGLESKSLENVNSDLAKLQKKETASLPESAVSEQVSARVDLEADPVLDQQIDQLKVKIARLNSENKDL